ncbi:MAG: sugar ABC transporter permease, partial [Bifidobacterium sp.]
MSHATATKTAAPAAKSAAKKPAKKKVSAFSTRKVDPAYYWMAFPAAIIFA